MEPNKNIKKAVPETAKPAQGSNKTLFWILGGCLVLLLIGALIIAGLAWWSYKKVKNEIKIKEAAMALQQKQLEAAPTQGGSAAGGKDLGNSGTGEISTPNISEEPAAQQPESAEGTTPYVAEKQIGYIKNVYAKNGKNYLAIDYVQWLTGNVAEKALREDGQCPKTGECIVYDDYYISNQNKLIRTFEISPDAKIVMQTYSAERTGIVMNNEEISLNQFKSIFSPGTESDAHLKDAPYIVEISNQQIVKVTEQYIP